MRVSEQVQMKRRLISRRLREASARFWRNPHAAELYPSLLFRVHAMARASVPLMETAVAKLKSMPESDPVVTGVSDYLVEQIPQEKGHDDWILEDLEALGIPREETLDQMPPPTVAALVGAQYYWIHHHHPLALLGYIAVVESETPTLKLVDGIVERTGLPREAFRNFRRHAILEPAHNRALDEFLDRLPFTKEHLSLIGVSVTQTANMVADVTEELLERHRTGGRDLSSLITPGSVTDDSRDETIPAH